jgi:hypothetical protein
MAVQHQQRRADGIQQRLQMILRQRGVFLIRLQPRDGAVRGQIVRGALTGHQEPRHAENGCDGQ